MYNPSSFIGFLPTLAFSRIVAVNTSLDQTQDGILNHPSMDAIILDWDD
jgi:hypothetical protein